MPGTIIENLSTGKLCLLVGVLLAAQLVGMLPGQFHGTEPCGYPADPLDRLRRPGASMSQGTRPLPPARVDLQDSKTMLGLDAYNLNRNYQIIPGAVHDYVRISSVDCSSDTGNIAAAYDNTVCIYEPTPLIHHNLSHAYCGEPRTRRRGALVRGGGNRIGRSGRSHRNFTEGLAPQSGSVVQHTSGRRELFNLVGRMAGRVSSGLLQTGPSVVLDSNSQCISCSREMNKRMDDRRTGEEDLRKGFKNGTRVWRILHSGRARRHTGRHLRPSERDYRRAVRLNDLGAGEGEAKTFSFASVNGAGSLASPLSAHPH